MTVKSITMINGKLIIFTVCYHVCPRKNTDVKNTAGCETYCKEIGFKGGKCNYDEYDTIKYRKPIGHGYYDTCKCEVDEKNLYFQ